MKLERIVPGSRLSGIAGDGAVEVVATRSYGPDAVEVTWTGPDGLGDRILYREDESRITEVSPGRRWAFDGDGDAFRLASEALRIRLAHLFDPYTAVNASHIEPLLHQLTAVYGAMLGRQPLRFLLADDPGAGKTVAGAESPAVAAAHEGLERRGSGQRSYRNALVFVAPDARNIDAAPQNARRERAWQSILKDADLRDNLTRAQTSDAKGQAERSREALVRSIRQAWVHVFHPGPPAAGDDALGTQRGYVIRSTRLINRGGAKGIPKVVWDKISGDGTVVAEMGPQNLARSLAPVWPADRPHVPIETIRDWFASYVYMPRLRADATLDRALERLIKDLAEPYVFAAEFDEDTGTYDGAIEGVVRVPADAARQLLVDRLDAAVGSPTTAIQVHDLNGDGRRDLMACGAPGRGPPFPDTKGEYG